MVYTRSMRKRSRSGRFIRYPWMWHAASSGSNYVRNLFSSQNRTGSRRTITSGQGVTNQYDRKTVYRKKRAPRYLKKKLKRQYKSYLYNTAKSLGSFTRVFNDLIGDTILAADKATVQKWCICHAYGLNGITPGGAIEIGYNDIGTIAGDILPLAKNRKILFTSCVVDLTMTNTSPIGATDGFFPNLEVDVYEFSYRSDTKHSNFATLLAEAFGLVDQIGAGTKINMNQRGITPFDMTGLTDQVKILRKTKYFLSGRQTATYQMRIPFNSQYQLGNIVDQGNAFINDSKPYTRSLFFIFKTTAGDTAGDNASFSVGVTRKYLWKILEDNVDLGRYQ